jgi:hypothetical protein
MKFLLSILLFSLAGILLFSLVSRKLDKLPGSNTDLSLDGCLEYCTRQHLIVKDFTVNFKETESNCVCTQP